MLATHTSPICRLGVFGVRVQLLRPLANVCRVLTRVTVSPHARLLSPCAGLGEEEEEEEKEEEEDEEGLFRAKAMNVVDAVSLKPLS
jgi:hypothetical protein